MRKTSGPWTCVYVPRKDVGKFASSSNAAGYRMNIAYPALYSACSLKELSKRAIKRYSLSFRNVLPADLTSFMNEQTASDDAHYVRVDRFLRNGKEVSPIRVGGFEIHPMTSLVLSIKFSTDLIFASRRYYNLLKEIDRCKELSDLLFVGNAIRRYERFVKLQMKYPQKILTPPLDICAVWLSHAIRTATYREVYKREFPKSPRFGCTLLLRKDSKEEENHKTFLAEEETEALWKEEFSEAEPFLNDGKWSHSNYDGSTWSLIRPLDVIQDRNWLGMLEADLGSRSFSSLSDEEIRVFIMVYELYLYHVAMYPTRRCAHVNPTIDLIWHAHLITTHAYDADMKRLLGSESALDHNPWPLTDYESVLYGKPFEEEFGIKMKEATDNPSLLIQAKAAWPQKLQHYCAAKKF